jgi:hypothetical protein
MIIKANVGEVSRYDLETAGLRCRLREKICWKKL